MEPHVFQALADPTRLRLLAAMRGGELPVGDLCKSVDIQQSGVSRHLRILTEAGLVSVRPEGQRRLYSLNDEAFRELDAWIAEYRALWEGRLDRLGLALQRRQNTQSQIPPTSEEEP